MDIVRKGSYRNVLGRTILFAAEKFCGSFVGFGYAEGVAGADGKPQGVYALDFDGKFNELEIIAVIERLNDVKDIWVGVSHDKILYEPYIRDRIGFYEKNYKTEYHFLYEKTCGSVLFLRDNGVKKYLLIKNDSGHIGFPKGHIEVGETERQTARREVFEETGVDIEINEETRQEYTYKTLNGSIKKCIYFCNEFDMQEIKIQQEEISESWLMPYEEAMKLLNFKEDRRILEKADGMYD